MLSARNWVEAKISWDINKGDISILWDLSLPSGKLGHRYVTTEDQKVADFVQDNNWNEQILRAKFEDDTVQEIVTLPICPLIHEADKMLWTPSMKGTFSLASAYSTLRDVRHITLTNVSIWKSPTPVKVSYFMSNLFRYKLPIDHILYKFGIHGPSICQCYLKPSEESFQHLFSLGTLARDVWKAFELPIGLWGSETDWRKRCTQMWQINGFKRPSIFCIQLLPSLICWNLWKARNLSKFQGEKISAKNIITGIVFELKIMLKKRDLLFLLMLYAGWICYIF